ncbi:putative enzyme related to lactoylglutathione lyase [Mycolicibacterium sp. BK634]|uniref:VOC family protein n=1 Tax=Mycolicibacterium sp. BK634 TaxID=2587099 RepID=UPI00161DA2B1|nr:VOC family protein [Mycolicibacterium sp. BK634]MBB3752803.1 putative enzyme related to lactoylglutathione lyase [Mycolicibacterium sp. BK634]
MHRNLLKTFIIDVPSAAKDDTVSFWAHALGATVVPTGVDEYTYLHDASPDNRIVVQDVGSSRAGVHFDIHTDDLDAEITRLLALGATMVDDSFATHPGRWVIMRDPAGLDFCVVDAANPLRGQEAFDDFQRRAKTVGSP